MPFIACARGLRMCAFSLSASAQTNTMPQSCLPLLFRMHRSSNAISWRSTRMFVSLSVISGASAWLLRSVLLAFFLFIRKPLAKLHRRCLVSGALLFLYVRACGWGFIYFFTFLWQNNPFERKVNMFDLAAYGLFWRLGTDWWQATKQHEAVKSPPFWRSGHNEAHAGRVNAQFPPARALNTKWAPKILLKGKSGVFRQSLSHQSPQPMAMGLVLMVMLSVPTNKCFVPLIWVWKPIWNYEQFQYNTNVLRASRILAVWIV